MVITETKLLSARDLLRLSDEGVRGELIRGILFKTMSSGEIHGAIVSNLHGLLWTFVTSERLGRLVVSDTGVLLERDPDTVREPDIAFTSAERVPCGGAVPGFAEVVPDLVVEVCSPTDSRGGVRERAQMWLSHGVRLVWVVDLHTRTVDVLRQGGTVNTLGQGDSMDGLDVLPGFACAVDTVFNTEVFGG